METNSWGSLKGGDGNKYIGLMKACGHIFDVYGDIGWMRKRQQTCGMGGAAHYSE